MKKSKSKSKSKSSKSSEKSKSSNSISLQSSESSSNNSSQDSDSCESSCDNVENLKGEILNGKYLIIYEIGSGSFATVWLSYNINNNKFNAIKIQNTIDYESGIEEVEILKKLNKENCVFANNLLENFVHTTEDGEHVCMVFELMAGSVYDIMRIGKYSSGLPLNTVKIIMYQLLTAMNILNSNLEKLHTDIKPENILVCGINNKFHKIIEIIKNNKKLQEILNKKNKIDKELVKNIIKDISFEEIENIYTKKGSDKKKELDFVDCSYMDNIKTKLSDFGSCREINYKYCDIQTRYYRAPEIILDYKYNQNCDMWSVGCVLYELLIGELLFDPNKKRRYSRNKSHLCDMISLLGKIPSDLIEKSKQKNIFFKKNRLIKGIYHIKYEPLYKILNEKLKDKPGYDKEQIYLIIDFIYELLNYNPFDRPTPLEALNHKFFDSLNIKNKINLDKCQKHKNSNKKKPTSNKIHKKDTNGKKNE